MSKPLPFFSLLLALLLTSSGLYAQLTHDWRPVGATAFSAGSTYDVSLALDPSGTPYVAYRDDANSYRATVMKFNGTTWQAVGSPGFSPWGVEATSLVIDAGGTPYIAYRDFFNDEKATVKKFNGSFWQTVGTEGFSAGGVYCVSLALDGAGRPYVAYRDDANGKRATVKKFNGSVWQTVGITGFSAGQADDVSLKVDASGTPYVAFEDYANGYRASVMKFDGTAWQTVGFSGGPGDNVSLALDASGTPYVAYSGWGGQATVMKFSSTSWQTLGTGGFSAGFATSMSIALDASGTPYVSYQDYGNNQKVTVMKFDGTSWQTVATPGFSAGQAYHTSLAIDGAGMPLVAYSDAADGFKTSVKKLSALPPYIATQPASVAVTGGQAAGFAVSATGAGQLTYQWQLSTNGGTTFNNISNGGIYSGVTSASLAISNAPIGLTGYQYRVLVSNSVGTASSSVATLTVNVRPFDNTRVWQHTGTAGFAAGPVFYTTLAVNASGTPYVAYRDGSNGNKATVMKYNGTAWQTVGAAGFSAGQIEYISLVLDASGTPYVAYRDAANRDKATVMKYNGTAWQTVGSAGFSTGLVSFTSLALNGSGTPYVAYWDAGTGGNSGKATVMKYNGTAWQTVGNARFSAGTANYTSLMIDASGTPYVAYRDGGYNNRVTVMRFNGSLWQTVGAAGFSAGQVYYTSLAVDVSGTPYVAYQDVANSNKTTVMKYNGTDWQTVGTAGFSENPINYTSLKLDASGAPFLAFQDAGNGNKVTVVKYDGTGWQTVGRANFTGAAVNYASLELDASETPYLAYQDGANGNKPSVMKFKAFNGLSWTGDADKNWHNAANWAAGRMPTAADDVLIPAGLVNYPEISAAAVTDSITLVSGNTSVSILSGGALTASGAFTLNTSSSIVMNNFSSLTLNRNLANAGGTFSANGGTVTFNSPASVAIPAFMYHNLVLQGGGTKTAEGNLTVNNDLVLDGSSLTFENNHTLTLKGHLENNALQTGTGKIVLSSGTAAHEISGTQPLQNLELNDALGAKLNNNMTVNNLTFTQGILDTEGFMLTLNNNLIGESSTRYLKGKVAKAILINGTGSHSFGNMGVTFNNTGGGNWGNVLVTRTTGSYVSNASDAGKKSILRRWHIQPTVQANKNVNLTLSWLTSEDNGLSFPDNEAQVWKSEDNGQNWKPVELLKPITANGDLRSMSVQTNSFSFWTVSDLNNPLPVSWLSFKGKAEAESNLLNWATATEQNSSHFEIQRSSDGKSFETIGEVAAAGNSNQVQDYTFADENATVFASKTAYYRLKQTDHDGKFEYSTIISISRKPEIVAINVYPNPFTETLTLDLGFNSSLEKLTIELATLAGKTVYKTDAKLAKGQQHLKLENLPALPSGVYLLKIQQGYKQTVLKVSKQ